MGLGLSLDAYNAVFKPLENRRAFQILPMLLHPRSKGYLQLKSRNPFHHPLLYPNFFSDQRDIETLLQGIREIIKITEQKPFAALGVTLYNATVPGCENTTFNTDDYWRCYIRHLSATLHHQIGTICISGTTPNVVHLAYLCKVIPSEKSKMLPRINMNLFHLVFIQVHAKWGRLPIKQPWLTQRLAFMASRICAWQMLALYPSHRPLIRPHFPL